MCTRTCWMVVDMKVRCAESIFMLCMNILVVFRLSLSNVIMTLLFFAVHFSKWSEQFLLPLLLLLPIPMTSTGTNNKYRIYRCTFVQMQKQQSMPNGNADNRIPFNYFISWQRMSWKTRQTDRETVIELHFIDHERDAMRNDIWKKSSSEVSTLWIVSTRDGKKSQIRWKSWK